MADIFLVVESCFQHGEFLYSDQYTAFESAPLAHAYIRKQEEMNLMSDPFQGFEYAYEVVSVPLVTSPIQPKSYTL